MSLHLISQKLNDSQEALEGYFEAEFEKTPPLLYLSCDIRNSGQKISVVDTNLYPAGFNNLCKAYTAQAVHQFKQYLQKFFPKAQKILLFTEAHTRNKFYFENISRLAEMLQAAGKEVEIGHPQIETSGPLSLPNITLKLHALQKQNEQVSTKEGWIPDLIISNNDFSSGPHPLLENIRQAIIPPMTLGWHSRQKSVHFQLYEKVCQEVGRISDLDPWLLSCEQELMHHIQLTETAGLQNLAKKVDEVLGRIQKKYTEYKIDSSPYVFIKNNSGTYGMGIAYVSNAEEVLNMNRRLRNKLLSSKGGGSPSEFLIQEGIPTIDSYSSYPMEPVIYMVGDQSIGGFFRLNEEKDEWSSLNTQGMAFSCLCLHKLDEPHEEPFLNCTEKANLLKVSFLLAKMAALAAAREATLL